MHFLRAYGPQQLDEWSDGASRGNPGPDSFILDGETGQRSQCRSLQVPRAGCQQLDKGGDLHSESASARQRAAVLLSHLSGENNTPQIAFDAMKHLENRFNLVVTSRREPTEVITIGDITD